MSPPWLGLLVGNQIVALAYHYVSGPAREARIVATSSAGPSFLWESGSIGDPEYMNLTGAPVPFWDFCEVMKGLFILVS